MNPRLRRTLIIILFLLLTIALGFAVWWFFFRPFFAPVTPPPTIPPTGVLPPVAPGIIPPTIIPTPEVPTPITPTVPLIPGVAPTAPIQFQAGGGVTSFTIVEPSRVVQPVLSTNGTDILYYNADNGFFYRLTATGERILYSDQAFRGVSNVVWSPDNRRAVLEYPDGSNTIYNFQTREAVTVPAHWKDFSFSTDGAQIVFKDMRLDKENRYIAVADITGQNLRRVAHLGDKDADVHITWSPNNKFAALYRQSIDIDRGEVSFIGFNEENFRTVTVEGRDLRFEWSPSGRKMVYSVYNAKSNYNPVLWVTFTEPDLLGTGKNNLGLQTWADKCAFASENEIYCAVPRALERGAGIAPRLADDVSDDIYKVNILTGQKELIAQPIVSTNVGSMLVSADGTRLYWTDKRTGALNSMDL